MSRKITGKQVTEEEPGGDFEPIPKGTYLAYIFEVDVREFGPNSKNAGREYYNVQYKIAEGQPYANRRLFDMVGLFTEWASGAENFRFFQFFAAVEGQSNVAFRRQFNESGEVEIPEPQDLEGHLVTINVGIEDNTYNGKTTTRNTIRSVSVAKDADNNITPTIRDEVVELDL